MKKLGLTDRKHFCTKCTLHVVCEKLFEDDTNFIFLLLTLWCSTRTFQFLLPLELKSLIFTHNNYVGMFLLRLKLILF
jgi:hypothetical protein